MAKAEWPSCQRNSRVLRKGWGCLNSHLYKQPKKQQQLMIKWVTALSKEKKNIWKKEVILQVPLQTTTLFH